MNSLQWWKKSMCTFEDRDRQIEQCRVTYWKKNTQRTSNQSILKEQQIFFAKHAYPLSSLDVFFKLILVPDETTVHS